MGFHSRLNSQDLHAPSRLPIRNDGTVPIRKGDMVFITGYISADGLYSAAQVAADYDTASGVTTEILGISDGDVINQGSTGSIVTFGVIESLSVPTGVTTTDRGRPLYVILGTTNRGTFTLDASAVGAEAIGTILGAANNVADVFVFALEAGFIRNNFGATSFKGLYEPTSATFLPNNGIAAGTQLAIGDYFVADAPATTTPFGVIGAGDLFVITSTPDANNIPQPANAAWVMSNFERNAATGGGTGSGTGVSVNNQGPLTSANFVDDDAAANLAGIQFDVNNDTANVVVTATIQPNLAAKINRIPDPLGLGDGEYVLDIASPADPVWQRTTERTADTNLEIDVELSSAAGTPNILPARRAYQLTDANYSYGSDTVIIDSTSLIANPEDVTGWVWLEEDITVKGTAGIKKGIIKGIIQSLRSTGNAITGNIDVTIGSGGLLSETLEVDNYIVGSYLPAAAAANPSVATVREVAFDGLSNTKFRSGSRLEVSIVNNFTNSINRK